jgi:K(+)-stimulated pyrophosphate-energized sodium pump
VVLCAVAAATFASYQLGARSGLSGGGLFGVALFAGGLLGAAPYVLAMDALGTIADTAGGVIELAHGDDRPDMRARTRVLDAVGATTKSFARVLATVVASIGAFLLVVIFLGEVWRAGGKPSPMVDVRSPALHLGALLGLLLVLVFVRVTLLRVVAAARELIQELRGQHEGAEDAAAAATPLASERFRQAGDEGAMPGPRVAGRRAGEPLRARQERCVEMVSRMALRAMLPPVLFGVGLPLSIGVALRILAGGDTVVRSAEALVALLSTATIAAAVGSLLFTHAGSAWDNAKKYIETGAHGGRFVADPAAETARGEPGRQDTDNPTYLAAVTGDAIGDPLEGAVGPATQALVTTLAALALVLLPLLS